jgi:hypothetical protein
MLINEIIYRNKMDLFKKIKNRIETLVVNENYFVSASLNNTGSFQVRDSSLIGRLLPCKVKNERIMKIINELTVFKDRGYNFSKIIHSYCSGRLIHSGYR